MMASYGYYIEKQNWTHWPKVLIMRHRTGLEPDETKRYVPEKTCHMVLMEDIRGHAYQDTYECDRCGEQVIRETYMWKSEPPNFCPKCGSRVKEGK